MPNSLWPHGLFTRVPYCSLSPGVCSDSCPLSQWCCLTISSSAASLSFCFQSFPASGSFPVSQLFTSGGQSIGVSASTSVLPMNIQDWNIQDIKKAEHRRIDAFEMWCWRRLLKVPWTAKRSTQSILQEISPKYSLKGLRLKLKLQYVGYLM